MALSAAYLLSTTTVRKAGLCNTFPPTAHLIPTYHTYTVSYNHAVLYSPTVSYGHAGPFRRFVDLSVAACHPDRAVGLSISIEQNP